MISLIITTVGNSARINYQFHLLAQQPYRDYEIVVVNDCKEPLVVDTSLIPDISVRVVEIGKNTGAANARNVGGLSSRGDILLFVGDDCYPKTNLLFYHAAQHTANRGICVQGYSPFSPDVMISEFMQFLDGAGMQANWSSVFNEDGSVKHDVTDFLLTTNFSIPRDIFLKHQFDTSFMAAAWEDVELGYRLKKDGIKTVFCPDAMNHHHHFHTPFTFAQRQYKEGMWRINLCRIHPELSASFIDLDGIRNIGELSLSEILSGCQEKFPRFTENRIEQQAAYWSRLMGAASLAGIRDRMKKDDILSLALNIKDKTLMTYVFEIIKGKELDNYGWAAHNCGWLYRGETAWYTALMASLSEKSFGNKEASIFWANESITQRPTELARRVLE